MWFWWFILACDVLIPLIMLISGLVMSKSSPKRINSLLGYRTARSMQNMETWKFAHEYSGKLYSKIGLITLVFSILVHLPFYHSGEYALGVISLVVMAIQIIVLMIPIVLTESALKKTFDEDGTRR